MLPRAEQKQQTRHALMDAARHLMECGRGFGSLSLREVAKTAGIVPTGFYRHFADMDQLGLELVSEVGQTFRETIRLVRHNEFVMGGIIDASVRIFLDVVAANRSQFLFLAREQYGGSLPVRQAIATLRQRITDDLAAIAASARAVISGPQLNQALSDLAEITATVKRVSERLDKRLDPMAEELQRSLKSTTSAMSSLDKAARSVDQTAAGVGRTSDRVSDLLAPDAPLVQNLQRAANEVSRTAGALREATAGDSQLMVGADRALDDLSRAARALRDLAEALEQQPDALLRGRKVPE